MKAISIPCRMSWNLQVQYQISKESKAKAKACIEDYFLQAKITDLDIVQYRNDDETVKRREIFDKCSSSHEDNGAKLR